jgi:transposase
MKNGREFWAGHVAAWRRSGLSMRAYSARHHVAKGTLSYWSWKLRRETHNAGELVELPAPRATTTGSSRHPIELVVEGRYLLRVWPGTITADIREVVTALEPRR